VDRVIIALLKGGLGNQLFIYAAARSLALRTERRLLLDTGSGFARDRYARSFRLERFPIEASTLALGSLPWTSLKDRRHRYVRARNKLLPRNWRSYISERIDRGVDQLLASRSRRKQLILNGYWQDERYFSDAEDVIRRELTPPEPEDPENRELGARLASTQSVSLHVRRLQFPRLLARDYYQQAIDAVCARLDEPRFAVFGDNPQWALRHLDFRGSPVEIIRNHADEVADLWLMTRCRHSIIANSTFSWWGAWLRGGPPGSLVFAPAESGFRLVMSRRWERLSATFHN
jgi:hypothetical protein